MLLLWVHGLKSSSELLSHLVNVLNELKVSACLQACSKDVYSSKRRGGGARVLQLCLSGGTPSAGTGQQGTLPQPHSCTGTSSRGSA